MVYYIRFFGRAIHIVICSFTVKCASKVFAELIVTVGMMSVRGHILHLFYWSFPLLYRIYWLVVDYQYEVGG